MVLTFRLTALWGTYLAREICCFSLFCFPIIYCEDGASDVPAHRLETPPRLSGLILQRWAREEADKRGNLSLNQCWLIITSRGGERGFPVYSVPPGSVSKG